MIANLRAAIADLPITDRGIDPDTLVSRLDDFQREIDETIAADRTRIANLEAALAEATEREEAIQLMFVAATKAKQQLTEQGEQRLEAANAEASRVVNSARSEAVAALNAARSEAEELMASASQEVSRLRKQHAEHEAAYRDRVGAMKSAVTALETQLRSIAETGVAGLAELRREIEAAVAAPGPVVAESRTAPPVTEAGAAVEPRESHDVAVATAQRSPAGSVPEVRTEEEPAADDRRASRQPGRIVMPDVPEREPAMPEVDELEPEIVVDATERAEALTASEGGDGERPRGSFYTRRSAKLPRIGTENNTMEVVGRMRTSRHRDGGNDPESNEEETEDLAYQHA